MNALRSDLGFVIIFGYKWAHQKEAKVLLVSKRDLKSFNDRSLLIRASRLIEKADLVVGHYSSVFDRRFIQGRLLINHLPPIPPTKMRDTCMIARSIANFSSNRLKHLAKILELRHQKLENNWPEAWFKVMQGNLAHLKKLGRYCKGDVLAVEDLYMRVRPYDNPHPRIVTNRSNCRLCNGSVNYRGFTYIGEYRYRRFKCVECGRWDRDRRRIE